MCDQGRYDLLLQFIDRLKPDELSSLRSACVDGGRLIFKDTLLVDSIAVWIERGWRDEGVRRRAH